MLTEKQWMERREQFKKELMDRGWPEDAAEYMALAMPREERTSNLDSLRENSSNLRQ